MKNGGFIQHKVGALTKVERKNGIYVLKMWLTMENSSSFQRPGVKRLRSVVTNTEKGTSRFDGPFDEDREVSGMNMIGDEGPKDIPAFWYLPSKGFRVVPNHDPLHKIARDMYQAADNSDNWTMILDTTVALNFEHAPFLSNRNFTRGKDALLAYANVQTATIN